MRVTDLSYISLKRKFNQLSNETLNVEIGPFVQQFQRQTACYSFFVHPVVQVSCIRKDSGWFFPGDKKSHLEIHGSRAVDWYNRSVSFGPLWPSSEEVEVHGTIIKFYSHRR